MSVLQKVFYYIRLKALHHGVMSALPRYRDLDEECNLSEQFVAMCQNPKAFEVFANRLWPDRYEITDKTMVTIYSSACGPWIPDMKALCK
jgi:hypothetical protein